MQNYLLLWCSSGILLKLMQMVRFNLVNLSVFQSCPSTFQSFSYAMLHKGSVQLMWTVDLLYAWLISYSVVSSKIPLSLPKLCSFHNWTHHCQSVHESATGLLFTNLPDQNDLPVISKAVNYLQTYQLFLVCTFLVPCMLLHLAHTSVVYTTVN